MLISSAHPPLPSIAGVNGTAALCSTGSGMSGDPFGITDVLGIVSNWITAKKQEDIQKKQIGVEQAALKQQKVVDAQNFAVVQAQSLTAASEKQRQDQVIGLIAVGVAGVVVAGILIYGAVRK